MKDFLNNSLLLTIPISDNKTFSDYLKVCDININIAVSDSETEKKLYFIDELNTQNTLDENQLNFLKNHHNIKNHEIIEKKIETRSLVSILDEYKFYHIDFMN